MERGASVDLAVKTKTGSTFVHFAAADGQVAVLEWLAACGADLLAAANDGGESAMHVAVISIASNR